MYIIMKLISGESIIGESIGIDMDLGILRIKYPYSLSLAMGPTGNMIWLEDWIPYAEGIVVPVKLDHIISSMVPSHNIIKTWKELIGQKIARLLPLDHQVMLSQLDTTVAN